MDISQRFAKLTHFQGLILLTLTAVLWSSGGFLIKSVAWHPLAIAGIRSGIAALVIRAAFYNSKLSWSRDQLAGAAAYAGVVTLIVIATKLTTAANAILLQYTGSIWIAVLGAWLLKEKTTVSDWLTLATVLGGMVLFFLDKMSAGGLWGNIAAIGCGFCTAMMIIFLRKQKDGSPFGSVFLGNVLTFFIGLPFILGSLPSGRGSWGILLLLGVFQIGVAYVLYAVAIKHVKALETSIITMTEAILNPLWVFLILGERPGRWALIGGAIILVALTGRVVLPAVRERQTNQPTAGQ